MNTSSRVSDFKRYVRRISILSILFTVTVLTFCGQSGFAFKAPGAAEPTLVEQDLPDQETKDANLPFQTNIDANLPVQSNVDESDKDNGDNTSDGQSIAAMDDHFISAFPDVAFLRNSDIRDKNGRPIPGYVNPALVRGASPTGTMYPPTAASAMGWKTESKLMEGMYMSGLNQLNGFNGYVNSDLKTYAQELQAGNYMARTLQYPSNVANQARAQTLATANAVGNAMGDMAKGQAASAITYCSSFMRNFTAEDGNNWNKIRNGLFVPIAILLLLPGAILTQVKAMVSAGNPALGEMNPFDGILRAVVAVFLIPATFLVVNYGIDFSNSIVLSIAQTYESIMGRNMYKDALAAQLRAFPVRSPKENQNAGSPKKWPKKKINSVSDYEDMYLTNKVFDPTTGEYIVPKNKTDEAMPAGAVAARELAFGTNAALTAAWNILCAFQMAYLAYLFFVGPIVAALWVWPQKQFRDALPNWVEGVCTVCFWSLFWNTAILLMASFKGVDQSGTIIMTALNFLATSSVKYAFDFSGLVKAAGQQAAQKAMEKGGAKGGVGTQGTQGAQGPTGTPNGTMSGNTTSTSGVTSSTTSNTTASMSSTLPNTMSTPTSSVLTPIAALSSFRRSGTTDAMPVEYQLPPMSLKTDPTLATQSAQLGGYVLTRGMKDGRQIDFLQMNGKVIAELPTDNLAFTESSWVPGLPITTSLSSKYDAQTGLTTYTLNQLGQQHTAQLNALDADVSSRLADEQTKFNDAERSVALRSQDGTMLLANDGRTLMVPSLSGAYDSYSIENGAGNGTFTLADGRTLFMSNDGRQTQVAINSKDGIESFSVSPSVSGFSIQHEANGTVNGTTVTRNGDSTVYTTTDADGRTIESDTISGNSIVSRYFDPSSSSTNPIGTAVREYDNQGGYTAYYRDASDVRVASATHELLAGGGYTDTIYDQNKNIVSVQSATPNGAGGFELSTARYRDGVIVDMDNVSTDASMNMLAAPNAVVNSNIINNTMARQSNEFNFAPTSKSPGSTVNLLKAADASQTTPRSLAQILGSTRQTSPIDLIDWQDSPHEGSI